MIVCCGEALVDFVPMTGETGTAGYRPCIGGSPYNVAVASARLSVPTGFLAGISTDFFGDMLVEGLSANGVDTGYVRRLERPTTLAFVSLGGGDEPEFAFFAENAADRSLAIEDLPPHLPDEVACLQFGSISLMQEPVASTLESLMRREEGRRVLSLDPNVRPGMITDKRAWTRRLESWVALVDVVKVSAADLEWLFPREPAEAVARRWLAAGPALVAVTSGADGAFAITPDGQRVDCPGRRVAVADTVGAGDTFHAGLLASLHGAGLLQRDHLPAAAASDVTAALELGARAAAITCTRPGADPPRRDELG